MLNERLLSLQVMRGLNQLLVLRRNKGALFQSAGDINGSSHIFIDKQLWDRVNLVYL